MNTKELFCTFDMDWANDGVLERFNRIIEVNKIRGTLNVTHDTKMLNDFRKKDYLELGIHPNFNDCLNGVGVSYKDVIDNIRKIVPEAITERAHALTKSSIITSYLRECGFKYESNYCYDESNGNHVYLDYLGMMQVPIALEDDVLLMNGKMKSIHTQKELSDWIADLFEKNSLLVLNFHPIHLFLNSECIERYTNAKIYNHDYLELEKHINNSKIGIFDIFMSIVEYAHKNDIEFKKIREIGDIE